MKKNTGYLISIFMVVAMLCGLSGCSEIDIKDNAGQTISEIEYEQATAEDEQLIEKDSPDETDKSSLNEEYNNIEQASSGEDLDVVMPNPADDDWYMKGNVYTDDKGNRLEVFFNDYGTLEFAVNGISMYITTVDNFQQENNWKVYTCDDGTMIGYFPGEPAHIEIGDGDYAGLYEEGGDKVN